VAEREDETVRTWRTTLRIYACVAVLAASLVVGGSATAAVTPVVVAGVSTPANISQVLAGHYSEFAISSTGRIALVVGEQIFVAAPGTGSYSLLAGMGLSGSFGDGGPAAAAAIASPKDLKWDASGNLFFIDGDYRIRKIATTGIITTVAGNGLFPSGTFTAGVQATATALLPRDFAVDPSGNIFILDQSTANGALVLKVATNGVITVFAGGAWQSSCALQSGSALNLRFTQPVSIAADAVGDLYLGVYCASVVEVIKIAANGTYGSVVAGGGAAAPGDGGAATSASINGVNRLEVVGSTLYFFTFDVAHSFAYQLRRVQNGILSTLSSNGACAFDTGVVLSAACLQGYAVSAYGLVVEGNAGKDSALAKVSATDPLTLTMLTAMPVDPADGQVATAHPIFTPIAGLAAKADGSLFFSPYTETYSVRSVSSGGILGTKAGTGTKAPGGFAGFGSSAATAQVPDSLRLSTSADGTLLMASADYGYVAKITPGGVLVKIAGTGSPTDGGVGGQAVDTAITPVKAVGDGTNVYVGVNPCDPSLCRMTAEVRKIGANGKITALYPAHYFDPRLEDLAISPTGALVFATGTGYTLTHVNATTGAATNMALPTTVDLRRIVVDAAGNVFGLDLLDTLYKVSPLGEVTTLATLNVFGGDIAMAAGNVYVSTDRTVYRFPAVAATSAGPAPTVTGFSSAAAQVGAKVRITGTNLANVSGLKFGSVAATSVHVVSATAIDAVVPVGATTGKVTATSAGGSGASAAVFTVVPAPTQIATGAAHSCARLGNGTVMCWGLNASGQLGNGSTVASKLAVPVSGLGGVTQVDTGDAFSCARLTSGAVKCWGANTNGQLGRGTTTLSKVPVAVLSTGTTALSGAGSVAAGGAFACAVVSPGAAGTVKCWGANAAGQLGDGTLLQRTRPVTVLAAAATPLKGVVSVSAGATSACAVLTSGAVRCWGANNHGQLGRGNLVGSKFAVATSVINGTTVKAKSVSVGANHACAVLTTGAIRCWGANAGGQLGDGTVVQRTVPVLVHTSSSASLALATAVSAGGVHTCAIVGTGAAARVNCWGTDANGQLGNVATGVQKFAVPVAGALANGVTALAAGTASTVAIAPNAAMPASAALGWGLNSAGQLGDGTVVQRSAPVHNVVI
jgi:alpha-tubulin suppressor-like RCC1 family protein